MVPVPRVRIPFADLAAAARQLGFAAVAAAPAGPEEQRALPGARGLVAFALPQPWLAPERRQGLQRFVARYALGRDYHDRVREAIRAAFPALPRDVVQVDAGGLPETRLAARAGLGRLGKNRLLLVAGAGSFVNIGLVVTLTDIEPGSSAPLPEPCGDCERCREACPAGALSEAGLDRARCLAALSGETRGALPPATRLTLALGCDRCQEACPRNMPPRGPAPEETALTRFGPADVGGLGGREFVRVFRGTHLARLGKRRLLRNLGALTG